MPSDTRKPARVAELVCQSTALLLLFGADDADLVAKLAAFLSQWVDVKAGRLGLQGGKGQ